MLIIFDCDGVLVDSEPLAAQVFSAELQRFGITLDAPECEKRFRGHTLYYCLAGLECEYPGRLPPDFLTILSEATQQTFSKQLLPVPGVESVLRWLRTEQYDFCVASNGALAKIHHSLAVTGLKSYFGERCFSAESVRAGKPAPDLFLNAADSMRCDPGQTLVVEDSSAGITAALSAGMKVCVFGGASTVDESAIHRFEHMAQLPQLIKDWIGS
jgi:HAD superfamily hydrolase (TIGR01509 family)